MTHPGAFAGRVVLVTGAGHGIGAAVARAVGKLGAAVAVNDVDVKRAARTVAELRKLGAHAIAVPGDVSTEGGAADVVAQATSTLGDLTGLVNNAGVIRRGTVRGLVVEDWEHVVRVNLLATALVSHAAFESLVRTGGAIVNLSSMASFVPTRAYSAYCAAKAAVSMLTKTTALEGAPHGVRANAVAPGTIQGTDMTAELDADPVLAAARDAAVPVGRLGRPEDVADVVTFLLSDAARYVTGIVVPVDGGMSISLHERTPGVL